MKPTYRIKDWDEHFETAESRKLKSTRWVPMPTKHDGKGYRRITQHNAAVEIFCAWNLIVQVASKMPTRGVLADSDGPLDADDLAAKTGFPSAIFASALPFLSSESIGWMATEQQRRARQSARTRQSPPEPARVPADSSPEGKGIEGNGKEQKEEEQQRPKRTPETQGSRLPEDFRVTPELRDWAREHAPRVDLEKTLAEFHDYWKGVPGAKGRKLDWPATFRNRVRELAERKNGKAAVAEHPNAYVKGKMVL